MSELLPVCFNDRVGDGTVIPQKLTDVLEHQSALPLKHNCVQKYALIWSFLFSEHKMVKIKGKNFKNFLLICILVDFNSEKREKLLTDFLIFVGFWVSCVHII